MAGDTARQEAGALYCKNRRYGVPLNSDYLAGGTVRQLYHNTETVMNEEEKSYVLEKI
jgi:hypothetical protein